MGGTEHYRAGVHLYYLRYEHTGPMPRHTYRGNECCRNLLTGTVPVLPPQFMMLILSIKSKVEVMGYPSSGNPEAWKDSHATDCPWQQKQAPF